MDIRKIDPKVLLPWVTGHIGTIVVVLLALLKVLHVDPTQVLIIGEGSTNVLGFVGYMTRNGLSPIKVSPTLVTDVQQIVSGVMKAEAPQSQESNMVDAVKP